MNSKFLLPIALFLFLVPVQVSVGSTNADHITRQAKTSKDIAASSKQHDHDCHTVHVSIEFPQGLTQAHHNSSSPDDGRTHQFHFNRLDKRRLRALLCFSAKVVLLLAHLCFLVCTHLHTTS